MNKITSTINTFIKNVTDVMGIFTLSYVNTINGVYYCDGQGCGCEDEDCEPNEECESEEGCCCNG